MKMKFFALLLLCGSELGFANGSVISRVPVRSISVSTSQGTVDIPISGVSLLEIELLSGARTLLIEKYGPAAESWPLTVVLKDLIVKYKNDLGVEEEIRFSR